jgi:hypothetical protein
MKGAASDPKPPHPPPAVPYQGGRAGVNHGQMRRHEVLRINGLLFNGKKRLKLTDGGKVVRLTRRQPLTLQKDSRYSFMLRAESTPGP